MTKYNFKITNTFLVLTRVLLACSITIITIFILSKYLKINDELSIIIIFLVEFYIILYLTKKNIEIDVIVVFVSKTKIEVLFKHPFIQKKKIFFLIPEIKSYSYEYVIGYKKFYLNTKNGTSLKFLISIKNLASFYNFYEDLETKIQEHNIENKQELIHEKPSIYKTKQGLFYGIVICLFLIIVPVCYFILKINIGILLILYPAGIFFLWRIYIERNKTY